MLKNAGFSGGSDSKETSRNAGDLGSVPGLGRSLADGSDFPLQGSCLENSMDRGAWRATVHEVAKSQTRLSDLTHTHTRALNAVSGARGLGHFPFLALSPWPHYLAPLRRRLPLGESGKWGGVGLAGDRLLAHNRLNKCKLPVI